MEFHQAIHNYKQFTRFGILGNPKKKLLNFQISKQLFWHENNILLILKHQKSNSAWKPEKIEIWVNPVRPGLVESARTHNDPDQARSSSGINRPTVSVRPGLETCQKPFWQGRTETASAKTSPAELAESEPDSADRKQFMLIFSYFHRSNSTVQF